MPFSLWRLLIVAGGIVGSVSIPLRPQVVFSGLYEPSPSNPDFAVGFDLSASYGAAALSFKNGTTVTVATVPAEDGYKEVMQRLSLESSQHLSPPYQHVGDAWYDYARQARRKMRKLLGLPASEDVGFIARMLSDLRDRVQEHFGEPIEAAGLSTLHLVALYQEDLLDAFEYTGIRYLIFPWRNDIQYQTNAAYAGYGYGICSDYTDPVQCKAEQAAMPDEDVMAVSYTRNVLTVSLSSVRTAYYLWEPPYRHFLDFTLGYDARFSRPFHQDYWEVVGARLEEIMAGHPLYPRPTKVLLMGDCVDDGAFQRTLQKALANQVMAMPQILSEDSVGVAAKGTAEFVKRLPFWKGQ